MKSKIVVLPDPKCFGKVGKPVMECSKCYRCFDCIETETERKIKEEERNERQ